MSEREVLTPGERAEVERILGRLSVTGWIAKALRIALAREEPRRCSCGKALPVAREGEDGAECPRDVGVSSSPSIESLSPAPVPEDDLDLAKRGRDGAAFIRLQPEGNAPVAHLMESLAWALVRRMADIEILQRKLKSQEVK